MRISGTNFAQRGVAFSRTPRSVVERTSVLGPAPAENVVRELSGTPPGPVRLGFRNPDGETSERDGTLLVYPAAAIQSPEKAWRFHDLLFENQDKLGTAFFKKTAKDLGLDAERCEKDADSQPVKDRIAADMAEAGKFGFNGTPGFLLNGIPVNGAYP